jgi:hypothetical protein
MAHSLPYLLGVETHIIGITHVMQLAVAAVFLLSEVASRRCGFVSIEHIHPAAFQEDINPDRWDG